MTWTRERPKGVDCVRNYQSTYHPQGARVQIYYRADVSNSPDGTNDASDSWWHPVRADGRYPALPVEDDRKWVPTKGHTLRGRGWNAYWDAGQERGLMFWTCIEAAGCIPFDFDYVLPYRDGDTRDTLPPLPSDETPAPLTPAEEVAARCAADADAAVLQEPDQVIAIKPDDPLYDVLVNRLVGSSVDVAPPSAPEPSRLEIAAGVLKGFCANPAIFAPNGMNGWQLVNCTEEQLAGYAYVLTDKLIAAARKGGAS